MFELPQNSAVDQSKSSCGSDSKPAILALSFDTDVFILQFTQTSSVYKLSSAVADLTHSGAHFPDSNNTGVVMYGGAPGKEFFSAKLGNSFKCASKEEIPFQLNDFKLQFKDLKLQPFVEGGRFGNEHVCFADSPAHWFLKNDKGEVCLLADFELEFRGMYETTENKTKQFSFKLPHNAVVNTAGSKCAPTNLGDDAAADEAILALTTAEGDNFIQVFTADKKKKTYSLTKATAMLKHSDAHFPDSGTQNEVVTYGGTVPHAALEADLGTYFKCNATENVMFNDKDKFELNYSQAKIQPFDVDGKFGKMSPCKADTPTTKPARPPVGNWTISNDEGKCMLMHFGAEFFITYMTTNKTAAKVGFYFPNDPELVQLSPSSCNDTEAVFSAIFSPDKTDTSYQWTMSMEFSMDKNKMYEMTKFSLEYIQDPKHFPDVNETETIVATDTTGRYETPSGSYYRCNSEQSFTASQVEVSFIDAKFQPFAQTVAKKGTYGTEYVCFADNPTHWFLKNDKGELCLLADFVLEFRGMYETTKKKMNQFSYDLSQNATVDKAQSKCAPTKLGDDAAADEATLALTTAEGDTFIQVFTADTKKKTYSLTNATAMLKHSEAHFPDSNTKGKVVTYGGTVPHAALEADLGSYFKCNATQSVMFNSKDKFELNYSKTRIQPFDVRGNLGKMSACKADTPTVNPAGPPVGNWTVSNDKGKCMLMHFGLQFSINYTMENKTVGKAGFFFPNDTQLVQLNASSCTNTLAVFDAVFSPVNTDPTYQWTLNMAFNMDKDKMYQLTTFSLEYIEDPKYFKDTNETKTIVATDKTKRFKTSSGSYYLCTSGQSFNASQVEVAFTDIKFQPFAQSVSKKGTYGTASECSADNDVSNIVPIAVGCALAGLVIIVLIAYLIGRSRTNRSGYQSV